MYNPKNALKFKTKLIKILEWEVNGKNTKKNNIIIYSMYAVC